MGFFSKSIPVVAVRALPVAQIIPIIPAAVLAVLNEPVHWIAPLAVDAWRQKPGRRAVWFHSPVDASATASMTALWNVPEPIRGGWPLVLVESQNFPIALATRWQLHGSSEIIVWDDGVVVWKGTPRAGPGSDWVVWADRVLLGKGKP